MAEVVAGLAEAGGGFVLGFLAGYAARRLIRVALLVLGAAIVAGYLAEQGGYVRVDWSRVDETIGRLVAWLMEKLASIAYTPPGLGFALGFLIGVTR